MAQELISKLSSGSAAYALAYFAGLVFWASLLVLGIVRCIVISRRQNANRKSLWSLAILLSGFLAGPLGAITAGLTGRFSEVMTVTGFVLLGTLVLALVLAARGLAEYYTSLGRYEEGRGQAVLTLVLSGLLLALIVPNVIRGLTTDRPRPAQRPAPEAPPEVPPARPVVRTLPFDAFKFQFRPPDQPWTQLDARKVNPNAVLAFMRSRPTAFFMIVAEADGVRSDTTADHVAEVARGYLRSGAASAQFARATPMSRNGLAGLQFESETLEKGLAVAYVHWTCVHNGVAYQLVCWGPKTDLAGVQREAAQMFDRFDLLETPTAPRGSTWAGVFSPLPVHARTREGGYYSDQYHYTVDLANSSWRPWSSQNRPIPEADFGAGNAGDAQLAVLAVCLLGQQPPQDTLARAMCSLIGLDPAKVAQRQIIIQKSLQGAEYETEGTRDGKVYNYRLRVVKGGDYAYLFTLRIPKGSTDIQAVWGEALQRVEILGSPQSSLNSRPITLQAWRNHVKFFTALASLYARAGQSDKSAACANIASQFAPAATAKALRPSG